VSLDTHRGIVSKLTFLHTITPSESIARHSGGTPGDECGVARGASAAAFWRSQR
jgi:hypothetical protein